ncbi:tyrosine-protein phosphatase [Rugosimonospora acidiphila]|uniref:tyrosine-protein phosphatase n=1 Tax=Rugosimonospora acidiphila TaxID=556531 RepID=UPI0031EA0528
MRRSLGLAGAPNVRDMGGLPAGGGTVREGLLYRAPALGRLTDQDVTRLGRCGLTDLLDLRHGSEIDVAPPDRLPAGPQVAHIPIFDPAHPVFTYVSAVLLGHDLSAFVDLGTEGTPGAMLSIYRWFVSSPAARAGFATAMQRITDATGPMLYHCSAGKDRTGWLSAILLSALGADRDTIRADYLLTNEVSAAGNEAILAAMASRRGVDPELVRPVFVAAPEYLDEAFAEADREYGSMDAYLRVGLGLDEMALARLRGRLLGPAR